MVLDAHTHAWGEASYEQPWVNGTLSRRIGEFEVDTVYESEHLLKDLDRTGIDEAVIVGYPICDWLDNWYTLQAASSYDRFYGIVMLDPFADDAAESLRTAMATDGVLGFRLGALCPYDRMWETFDSDVSWLRRAIDETAFWKAAVETDAVVQILCHHCQLDQAIQLVESYPELTYLFDHFAHADPDTPTDEGAFSRFEELADYPGVAVKISEIPHMSDEDFPYADMHDHVRWLRDVFGRERVIWGSDFPNVSDVATYSEALHWLEQVEGLSGTDHQWMTEQAFREHVLS